MTIAMQGSATLRYASTLALLAAVASGIAYSTLVIANSVNIPERCDYIDVLGFMLDYLDAGGAAKKWTLIVAQHNEHRNAFSRLVYLMSYYATGEVNFAFFTLVGNLSVPLFLWGLFLQSKNLPNRKLLIAISALLLFQIQSFMAMFNSMVVLSNYYVNLLAFFALVFLLRDGRLSFLLALAFGAAATLTFGSGQLVFGAGAVLLVIKRYRGHNGVVLTRLAAWATCAITTHYLFRLGYDHRYSFSSVAAGIWDDPWQYIDFFLTLVGGIFSFGNEALAGYLGGLFLLLFSFCTFKGWWREAPVIYCYCLFLLASALLISATRSGFGTAFSLEHRYLLISSHLWLCLLLGVGTLLDREPFSVGRSAWGRHALVALALLAIAFNIAAYSKNLRAVSSQTASRVDGLKLWQRTGSKAGLHPPFLRRAALTSMETAIRRGVYRPPSP